MLRNRDLEEQSTSPLISLKGKGYNRGVKDILTNKGK